MGTCFETFPFPKPTDDQRQAIGEAARELDRLRTNWLNPPEWTREEILEFPGSLDGPWARYIDRAASVPRSAWDRKNGRSASSSAAPSRTTQSIGGSVPTQSVGTSGHASGSPGDVGMVRYPRLVPKDEQCAKELKKRTLTNLYNQRPAWLDLAHRKLDEAVSAAYGWPPTMSDDELLARLLELNLARAK